MISPPPLWGRSAETGVGRFRLRVGGREVLRARSTPSPAPPHKGEGRRPATIAATLGVLGVLASAALDAPAIAETSAHGLYMLHCSGRHGRDGAGSKTGRVPPFSGIVGYFAGEAEGRRYLVLVPGVAGSGLSDADTARVLNYVIGEWGEDDAVRGYVPSEVAAIRASRVDDIVALRGKIVGDLARRGIRVAY